MSDVVAAVMVVLACGYLLLLVVWAALAWQWASAPDAAAASNDFGDTDD